MDLGLVATAVLRPGVSTGLRDERIALSLRLVGAVLDGNSSLADISPDLASEIRSLPVDATATLILPAGPGPARIDLNGRTFVVPGALRDALIAVLNASSGASASRAATLPAAAAAAAAEASTSLPLATEALVLATTGESPAASTAAANLLAASGTLRTVRNESGKSGPEPLTFAAPVFDPRTPAATPQSLAARVSDSGAFFEAHVAQWLRGDRTGEAVQSEAQQLARTFADPALAQARTGVQLDALQRQAIALTGPAWSGQPMQLEIAREQQVLPDGARADAAEAPPVFVARLKMDLPRLGTIEVRLRLAGDAIAASIEGVDPGAITEIERALPDFAAGLAARGLRPVLLRASGRHGDVK